MENGYNGWKNWETWNYKLWMDEEGETNFVVEQLHEQNLSVDELAAMLDSMAWNRFDEMTVTSGFIADVAKNALYAVDFNEIAENIIGANVA